MLPEKFRTTLMTLFRVPLNVFLIILLLSSKYFDPFYICLIVSGFLVIAFVSSVFLIFNNKDSGKYHDKALNDIEKIMMLEKNNVK